MTKRSMPQVAASMERLADDLEEAGLPGFARRERRHRTEVFRKKSKLKKTAATKAEDWPRPSPKQVLQIRAYWEANAGNPKTRMTQHQLGEKYGVHNDGRVTEILKGDKNGRPMYSISGYYIPPSMRKLAAKEK